MSILAVRFDASNLRCRHSPCCRWCGKLPLRSSSSSRATGAMSDGSVTVAHCVEGLPVGAFLWEVLLCAFLASFLLGALCEPSPFALGLVSTEWLQTEQSIQAISASLALGNFLSVLVAGWMADRYGRLSVIRSSIFMTLCCGMVVQSATTLGQALASRLLLGLASGALVAVLMTLVAELLPSKRRGFYLTVWCCGKPAGSLFAILVSCLGPGMGWSTFSSLMLVPAMVLYILARVDMLPESPRHLYLVGRRHEGYNILLDMYEKELLPLPWAPDSIAVTTAPSKSATAGSKAIASSFRSVAWSNAALTAWLCIAVFFVSAADQCMKTWAPAGPSMKEAVLMGGTSLSLLGYDPLRMEQNDHRFVLVLAQGYMMELIGIVLCAFLSSWISRKQMVQYSLLSAAVFSVAALALEQRGWLLLSGPLVGMQLVAQAAALNFLQVFACEKFPTSCRATTVALVVCSGQLARFCMPAVAGLLVRRVSDSTAIFSFSCMYLVGLLVSFQLPLPSGREKPLHDVEEERGPKEALAKGARKHPVTYQTV
ncbi:unnamed protein product [Polarella glacialis]|uniref:Major facilitator superfamily (MFS) profile domain-containing protein n=1 Tax=Polarella glacialis TaxID=89957 RepID=A0A813G194_POLGL|nr:unnamed protein product [Polarella glacialis]CAE8649508.1 unnamed protein product [Polarella glacialis]